MQTGIPETELYDKAIEEFLAKFNTERAERQAKAAETKVARPKRDPEIEQSEHTELTEEEKEKYRPIRLSMEKLEEVMKTEDKKPE